MKYPSTPVKKHVETIHGHRIIDNYRWLERNTSSNVKKWIDAQNKLVDQVVPRKLQVNFEKELKQNYNFLSMGTPHYCNGQYFGMERRPGQERGVLYVWSGLNGKRRILINPNKLSQQTKHIVSLDYWVISPKGNYVAYGVSEDGKELAVLKVMEVKTGQIIEIIAKNASWASITWMPDETGFYYTKHPDRGSVAANELRYYQKAYYHKLGTKPSSDKEIFGGGRPKEEGYGLELSNDGRWLAISATQDWERNDLYMYDSKSGKLTNLIVGYQAQFEITFTNERVLLYTNYKAPNYRVLSASLDNFILPPDKWGKFIPERKNKLSGYAITKDQLLAIYLINATAQGIRFDLNGKETGKLTLPKHASLSYICARREETEFFYDYQSFTTPGIINHYNPATRIISVYYRNRSTINESDYLIKQEWFKSKDGTQVPMFIVHHKGLRLNGKNPTILYGYGGFEMSNLPFFLRHLTPWLSRGGVYAIANIRGGGEFGKTWHTGGIKKYKQKSYDDFIAAAQYLITKKYTNNKKIGILGASNGGLLVSAVAVQTPELFKAVVSQVPLTDMVRFPKFLIASRWKSEYGDPDNPEDLKYILKYSPYHNVKNSKNYPAFLFITAENDTRVHPMHAYKMAALLQSKENKEPVLVYTENSTGHQGSLTMSRFYKDQAKILTFFVEQLGLNK
jgi:prolyl oligopeptidase